MFDLHEYTESGNHFQRSSRVRRERRKGGGLWSLVCAFLFIFSVTVAAPIAFAAPDDSGANGNPGVIATRGTDEAGAMSPPPIALPAIVSAGKEAADNDREGKDLDGFFAIGLVANIILIGAFIYWAAGQWRKTK